MSTEAIRSCFRKVGILDDSFSVCTRPHEHDSFLDNDLNTPEIENLESLAEVIQSLIVTMTLSHVLKLITISCKP